MDILGIGPLEFVFVFLIALIVLGPNDMVKAGRTLGRFLRKLVTSPSWQMVQQTSKDLRYLPNKLMREAGLEELKEKMPTQAEITKGIGLDDLKKEIRETDRELDKGLSAWTTPSKTIKTPAATPEITPGQVEITVEPQPDEPADSPPAPAADSAPQADAPQISQTKDETGTE